MNVSFVLQLYESRMLEHNQSTCSSVLTIASVLCTLPTLTVLKVCMDGCQMSDFCVQIYNAVCIQYESYMGVRLPVFIPSN